MMIFVTVLLEIVTVLLGSINLLSTIFLFLKAAVLEYSVVYSILLLFTNTLLHVNTLKLLASFH